MLDLFIIFMKSSQATQNFTKSAIHHHLTTGVAQPHTDTCDGSRIMFAESLQFFLPLFQCSWWDATQRQKQPHFGQYWPWPCKTFNLILTLNGMGSAFLLRTAKAGSAQAGNPDSLQLYSSWLGKAGLASCSLLLGRTSALITSPPHPLTTTWKEV